jgi:sterol desaturase/sphingolipid hydroxylase (fatty acid hydroxylase superfamily)
MDTPLDPAFVPVEASLEALAVFAFVVILLEVLADRLLGRPRDFTETWTSLAVGLGQDLLGKLVGTPIALAGLSVFAAITPWSIPVTPWSWPIALLAADFVYYWVHRLEHRSRLFWAHHSVHHSSTSFDLATSTRIAWVEPLLSWYGLIPLVLLGFHPLQAVAATSILLLAQVWIHTEKVGKLGALEGILNTPSAHRVHHGSNPEYLDANYGAVLMIWDRLYGTYVPEDGPVRYGLTSPIETHNPVRVNLEPYRALVAGAAATLRAAAAGARLRQLALWVFGPPEWSAAGGFAETRPTSLWLEAQRVFAAGSTPPPATTSAGAPASEAPRAAPPAHR